MKRQLSIWVITSLIFLSSPALSAEKPTCMAGNTPEKVYMANAVPKGMKVQVKELSAGELKNLTAWWQSKVKTHTYTVPAKVLLIVNPANPRMWVRLAYFTKNGCHYHSTDAPPNVLGELIGHAT